MSRVIFTPTDSEWSPTDSVRTPIGPFGVRRTPFGVRRKSDNFRRHLYTCRTPKSPKRVRRTPIGPVGPPIGVRRTHFGLFGVRINFWSFRTTFRTSLKIFESDSDFNKSEESPNRTIWTKFRIFRTQKNVPSGSIGLNRTPRGVFRTFIHIGRTFICNIFGPSDSDRTSHDSDRTKKSKNFSTPSDFRKTPAESDGARKAFFGVRRTPTDSDGL